MYKDADYLSELAVRLMGVGGGGIACGADDDAAGTGGATGCTSSAVEMKAIFLFDGLFSNKYVIFCQAHVCADVQRGNYML